jgi:hypothetical protein
MALHALGLKTLLVCGTQLDEGGQLGRASTVTSSRGEEVGHVRMTE